MAFIDSRFSRGFSSLRMEFDPPASPVLSLGEQRRSGLVMGTSLASSVLVSPSDGIDPGLDPRYDLRFSKLDLAAEFMERRQTFLANQEAQKQAAQAATEKAAAVGDLPVPAASE